MAVIDLDRHVDPVTVFFQFLEATGQKGHDLFPLPFEARSHRSELIGQTAVPDDADDPAYIGADAFSLIGREHGQIDQYAHRILLAKI